MYRARRTRKNSYGSLSRHQAGNDDGHFPASGNRGKHGRTIGILERLVLWRTLIPGEVAMNDINNIIPMNPPIAIVELTGKTQKYGRNRHAHTQRGIETLRAFLARDRPPAV